MGVFRTVFMSGLSENRKWDKLNSISSIDKPNEEFCFSPGNATVQCKATDCKNI